MYQDDKEYKLPDGMTRNIISNTEEEDNLDLRKSIRVLFDGNKSYVDL
jgi:hypothetical protein